MSEYKKVPELIIKDLLTAIKKTTKQDNYFLDLDKERELALVFTCKVDGGEEHFMVSKINPFYATQFFIPTSDQNKPIPIVFDTSTYYIYLEGRTQINRDEYLKCFNKKP